MRAVLLLAALAVAGASCSGGGAGSREARARSDAGTHASSQPTSSSSTSSSTMSSSTIGSSPFDRPSTTTTSRPPVTVRGSAAAAKALASWYGAESGGGTANGEHFDGSTLTFANRTMAFGTRVRFCHGARCVVARCNDRGPFAGGRTFDLSRATFASIADLGAGVITVEWSVVP